MRDAARIVHAIFPPTPTYRYPLLDEAAGTHVFVKHENHTPVGAFKVRGGFLFVDWLVRSHPRVRGVISATRGNHGQSIAVATRRAGLGATIVVPQGNSVEKNAAMHAQGAELIIAGHDVGELPARPLTPVHERAEHDRAGAIAQEPCRTRLPATV